jgi:hypothetical protein
MAHGTATPTRSPAARAWAVSGLIFAASMMIMLGIWQVFIGIAAIAGDDFFVIQEGYVYNLDTTAWGWIHVVLGAVVVLTGLFLFSGAAWARAVGILLAALAVVNNFLFLPYYPVWSIMVIALAVFVIWALATVRTGDVTGA